MTPKKTTRFTPRLPLHAPIVFGSPGDGFEPANVGSQTFCGELSLPVIQRRIPAGLAPPPKIGRCRHRSSCLRCWASAVLVTSGCRITTEGRTSPFRVSGFPVSSRKKEEPAVPNGLDGSRLLPRRIARSLATSRPHRDRINCASAEQFGKVRRWVAPSGIARRASVCARPTRHPG